MVNVIVAFPKIEDAKGIRNLLVKYGFSVAGVHTSGARALARAYELGSCIIVTGYQLADMIYEELWESMPEYARMLLLTGKDVWAGCNEKGILYLAMPFKAKELIDTMNMLADQILSSRRRRRSGPRIRSRLEEEIINDAKKILGERNHMTEEEAHRYLQKCSMENGSDLVETARMVLSINRQ